MKDHEIAQTVNQLRDAAMEYGQTQQLRERIAAVIAPILTRQQDERLRIERLRKGLFEARDALRVMSEWVKKSDPAGHSWAERMIDRANDILNHAPEALTDRIDHIDAAGYVHWKVKK